jgi:hypothetical protein
VDSRDGQRWCEQDKCRETAIRDTILSVIMLSHPSQVDRTHRLADLASPSYQSLISTFYPLNSFSVSSDRFQYCEEIFWSYFTLRYIFLWYRRGLPLLESFSWGFRSFWLNTSCLMFIVTSSTRNFSHINLCSRILSSLAALHPDREIYFISRPWLSPYSFPFTQLTFHNPLVLFLLHS